MITDTSIDFGKMNEREITAFNTIMMNLIGKHFTRSCTDCIKKFLEAATIVDSKGDNGITDPEGIPGYIEPGRPYFGKPIKFTVKTEER